MADSGVDEANGDTRNDILNKEADDGVADMVVKTRIPALNTKPFTVLMVNVLVLGK